VNQPPITAGKVDDNADFNTYLDYIHNYYPQDVMRIPVEQRLFLKVIDHDQHPVAGARVQLFDGQREVFEGTTVSDGSVLFFPQAAGVSQSSKFRAVVSRGQATVEVKDVEAKDPPMEVQLKGIADNTGPVGLDLVFLLDATGSMGDEIDRIKGTVDTIASRIEQLPGSSKPRFGLVAFRDRGDDFITRSWDFTGDVKQFSQNLANVEAGGGGDDPESVNAGLHDAIHLPGWADNSTGRHLRMIVLVGDAPPHLDYPNDYRYPDLLNEAVASGIKIFPIGASGLDDQGEYIFRQFAEITQGQFVFLTYANGVSGAPGIATDNHVSNFTVSDLDSLVVSLVAGEVANQTGDKSGNTSHPVVAPVGSIVPVQPDPQPPLASGIFSSLVGVVQSWLSDAWQWLLLLWLPALLLADWWRRNRRHGDLRRAPLSEVEFDLPPAPTTDLSKEDLPEAARLAVSVVARVSAPFSPTLPVRSSLYPSNGSLTFPEHHLMATLPENALPHATAEIQPTSAQGTVALNRAGIERDITEW